MKNKETILIIGEDVFNKLSEKEKEEFHYWNLYRRMHEEQYLDCNPETNEEVQVDWEGDNCFEDIDELIEFSGEENIGEICIDVYTSCFKVFDEEEDLEYFQDLAKDVKGKQVKLLSKPYGWYEKNKLENKI